jgi:adenylate kinase family enzyme
VRRIWVVSTSGSGKSTLARSISEQTTLPWIQLDSLYHQPSWTPLPKPEFRATVAQLTAREGVGPCPTWSVGAHGNLPQPPPR